MTTITCGNCKLQGHKYTSCVVPLRPDFAIRKNNHKASRSMPAHVPPPSSYSSAAATAPRPPPSSFSSAVAPAPRPPPATPRNHVAAFVAPRTPFAAPKHTNAASGLMSYFTAGANASVARDANVPPLAVSSSAGPS